NQTGAEKDAEGIVKLGENGWNVVSSENASGSHSIYQSFIFKSKAEISVAKETYVKAKTGWFSCRSACYLAAGRPVVTQDTGWSYYYPCGKGLFAFTNQEEAIEAINKISKDWDVQSKAAIEISHAYFDHNIVLKNILESV
ncbi:MAG: glycosyltransferase family 1 protein, partial [Bacteroidetes bacterium]|nr:glycosyltransferase family 1 protein [Bacteroidota bacterium]